MQENISVAHYIFVYDMYGVSVLTESHFFCVCVLVCDFVDMWMCWLYKCLIQICLCLIPVLQVLHLRHVLE